MKLTAILVVVAATAAAGAGVARGQEAPPPQPTPSPTPAAPAGASGGSSQTANYFNPSVSVIGNFLAVGGRNDLENLPSASLRESELGLQSVVDPYARADFFISFGEHDVSVEEGFITFTALPWDLLVKAGRMRVAFGKINTLHLHVLPWPDEPLTVVDLLGGEDGWIGSGVSVARLIPLPGDVFSELTVQAVRADTDGLFKAAKRWNLAYNGHYRVFADLSDSTNLDAGVSYAFGPNGSSPDDSARTRLAGLDVTLRWKPLAQGTYRSAIVRGELIRRRMDAGPGSETGTGWFLSGDYQLAKRWWVGVRGEHAISDSGLAATLTFNPSEFSQLRTELRRRSYGGPNGVGAGRYDANEVLLQLQFAIGAHGAHPF